MKSSHRKILLWLIAGIVVALGLRAAWLENQDLHAQIRNLHFQVKNFQDQRLQEQLTREKKERQRDLLPKKYVLHALIQPDRFGKWRIRNDVDHASSGMHPDKDVQLTQSDDYLRLYFDKKYKMAGAIQVTTDDNFAGSIIANANLGLDNATIYLRLYPKVKAQDKPFNPAKIWKYVTNTGGGNLWVTITMID